MKSIASLLFGGGWWTLWYGLHWLLLLPLWGFYGYFRAFKPGAGPQGGEAIFLFMVLYGLVLLGIGIANTIIVMAAGGTVWWKRFLVWPAALIGFPLVALFLGFAMADAASDPDLTASGRLRMAITLPALILIYYAVNLGALATARG